MLIQLTDGTVIYMFNFFFLILTGKFTWTSYCHYRRWRTWRGWQFSGAITRTPSITARNLNTILNLPGNSCL